MALASVIIYTNILNTETTAADLMVKLEHQAPGGAWCLQVKGAETRGEQKESRTEHHRTTADTEVGFKPS